MDSKEYAAKLGAKVREARTSRKLRQDELASLAEISPSYLSEIERGIYVPTADKIQRLAKALRLGLSRLLPES